MIGFLQGVVLHREEEVLLVRAGEVGYEVTVTAGVLAHLHGHETICLYVHTHQPQGFAPMLFGFHTLAERRLFRELIEVNTVGPKMAIRVLAMPFGELLTAIARKDVAMLTSVKGLGKKTAEKICLDLADKMIHFSDAPLGATPLRASPNHEDADAVLRQLGFTPPEISKALGEIEEELSAEELVAEALKRLGR